MQTLLSNFILLLIESAPWLLLGFTIAGFIKAFIPQSLLVKHLGKNTPLTVIKAALIGAPLPLCSCGVIPAAIGLRRAGASKASTTAFLISTPETGVDSISITYALMGWFMAVVRPIAAIVSAISAGLLVLQLDKQNEKHKNTKPNSNNASNIIQSKTGEQNANSSCCNPDTPATSALSQPLPKPQTNDCCASKNSASQKPKEKEETKKCCEKNTHTQSTEKTHQWTQKIASGLRFSMLDLSKDVALWLIIGLTLAAIIKTFVPVEWLTHWGDGWLAFLIMAIVGVPMYICATASTPIAAAFLFSGVSPGAVLVFMLVGPATNIATISLVKQELGTKPLIAYLSSIVSLSFLFGWLVNIFADQHILIKAQTQHHHMENNYLSILSAIILSALLIRGLFVKYYSQNKT